jgi:predicted DNA-binding transcriptional regulator AlpA
MTCESPQSTDLLMYLPEVLQLTRRSYSTIWRRIRTGRFPRPIAGWGLTWCREDVLRYIRNEKETKVTQ